MSLTLTFLGHAGFLLDAGQHKIVIDPFLTGNDLAKQQPADIACGHVVLTHGHYDHIADAVAIAKANKATGYGAFEVCNFLGEHGVESVEPGNPGGKITTPFGYVAYTQAFHSSSFEGRYMGMPLGVVVSAGGVTVYHTGDTGLFSDMQLIGEIYKPDIALIPIGDRFTMGPELATRAAEFIKPKVAIPMHYKTFGALVQDASGFTPKGVTVKVMEPGETWKYS